VAVARAGFLIALAGLGAAAGWDVLVLYYVVPYLTTYQIFRFWSDAADHAGLMSGATEFDRARNHTLGWAPLDWLVFPRHDQYHLVHHLFPAVPTRLLATMHARLMAAPVYAARDHGLGARS
jgi:fatty acid desaturase